MQSNGRDKRINAQLLLDEEIDPSDGSVLEVKNEAISQQDQLAALIAKHENLRRQVALLKAQLSGAREKKTALPELDLRNRFDTRAVTLGILALAAGMLWALTFKGTAA